LALSSTLLCWIPPSRGEDLQLALGTVNGGIVGLVSIFKRID